MWSVGVADLPGFCYLQINLCFTGCGLRVAGFDLFD
jgi:hypothetical protein